MTKKLLLSIVSLFAVLFLAACSINDTNNGDTTEPGTNATNNQEGMDKQVSEEETEATHEENSSNDLLDGIKVDEDPKFPVGSKAIINASHTDGMEGAEAKILSAYETTVYSVSYTPTNGDPFEENHKWFIKEEITGLDEETLDQGAEVIIDADHLPGMKGATGTIDTVEETTVYIVDYTNSLGETVKNHRWLKESELTTEEQ